MKSKIDKYLKYIAAAVFVATLAINVVITLDDPFVLLSDAMAETTTTTTTTTGTKFNIVDQYTCVKTNHVITYEKEIRICNPGGFLDCEPFCRERWVRNGGGILGDWVDCD